MQVKITDIVNAYNVIDIRSSIEYNRFSYPGSQNIPKASLLGSPELYLNKNETYYLICSKGKLSNFSAKILNARGYNCYSVEGGIEAYKELLGM